MAKPGEKYEHDPHDPRGGSSSPTGPQGTAEQERWQESKHGEATVRERSIKAAEELEERRRSQ